MQRLYCYVDESGQDTKGSFFLVALVLTDHDNREALEQQLFEVEEMSLKRKLKWRRASFERRLAYLTGILQLGLPRDSLFYGVYQGTTEYVALITDTVAKAFGMRASGDYRATVVIDGLNDRELRRVTRGLRELRVRYRNVRGLRDESSPFLRLADALAGFLRDYEEGQPYTDDMYGMLLARGVLTKLE